MSIERSIHHSINYVTNKNIIKVEKQIASRKHKLYGSNVSQLMTIAHFFKKDCLWLASSCVWLPDFYETTNNKSYFKQMPSVDKLRLVHIPNLSVDKYQAADSSQPSCDIQTLFVKHSSWPVGTKTDEDKC